MTKRIITILGGGHGARTTAADMALAGHEVRLFELDRFHASVAAIFAEKAIEISGKSRNGRAKLAEASHDIASVLRGAELILVIVPALYHLAYAQLVAPHLADGQHVVLIPGTLGSLEFVRMLRERGCRAKVTVSELDTLPYAARIVGPVSVYVYHALPTFGIGTFPSSSAEDTYALFSDLYPGTNRFRDVLEAGLSNCNPVIHPLGVLMNAGRIEYSRGEFWYYEEGITDSTTRAMEALDLERISIGAKLGLQLPSQAESLHSVGYGPKGDLWEVLKGSKGLTPIKGPTSLSNRYVTEDIPIGLVCWSQIGEMLGVPTPLMRATVEIGIAISGENYWKSGRTLERCGIAAMTPDQLCEYVRSGRPRG